MARIDVWEGPDPTAKWSLVRERTNDATAELLLLLLLIVLLVMTFEELG
jgi:hypothetical protein